MNIGNLAFNTREEAREYARFQFLSVAHQLEPRLLKTLFEDVYCVYKDLDDPTMTSAFDEWAYRYGLYFNQSPAPWVEKQVKFTFLWWTGGKPTWEQQMNGKRGDQPLEPLEWLRPSIVGMPTILQDGDKSPWVYMAECNLELREGETAAARKRRLLKQHGRERSALVSAIERAEAIEGKRKVSGGFANFDQHVDWAVRFQLMGIEVKTISAGRAGGTRTVDAAINSVLRFIGLARRESTSVGRPRKISNRSSR